ncbi:cysteine synthase A [Paraferrimonas sedimenticola]|uniref:Cysteine synthase n=1 Tax=Paraferrimonas sedimenticola TaxID=375674 RepID=A0AA37RVN0_9GAMM|nr:cysteine synthase A [Paraferrimonas sedimenticola]GLP95467.1 cysteine synthase A [Paraferrimonas sedimenticola]
MSLAPDLSNRSFVESRGRIFDDITQTVGCTPLVRLSRFKDHYDLHANVLAKVESFNPAGSIKDRPAMAMIEAMIEDGRIGPDSEIIEATSGNNGVACAWICAMKKIPLTIVIPEHMSIERRKLIQLYGAKLELTPKALGTKGAIDRAKQMISERPNAVMLDQFANPANLQMHAKTTAEEIWADTQGKVDVLIAGVGTGGTVSGIAEALKARKPDIKVIAVEPASCPVLSEGRSGVHKLQGLSSGHVPDILRLDLIDEIMTVENEAAIEHAREIAQLEGLPVGISSGAALNACRRVAARLDLKGKNVVTILADNAERYISTELFDLD